MPLGSRELFLIIRARDEASRTLRTISGNVKNLSKDQRDMMNQKFTQGQMLTGMGTALTGVGVAGVAAFGSLIKAGKEYETQAALTTTQTSALGLSLKDIEDIGKRVAMTVGAPMEQLQAALFDIFSSTEMTGKQAEKALEGMARAAVAGGTTVETAGDATISIMNGFGLKADELNDVLDFQFRLVEKGRGTYEEFATSIGRAVPSANAAGQSYEDLGGALAFMTIQGFSAAEAATSVSRGFEAITKTKVADRLKDMGVSVKDARGEFRPMVDIVTDLNGKLKDMTGPERADALQELLKGANNSKAARNFFTQATENLDVFTSRTAMVKDSAGAMGRAYDTMSETVAVKIDLMKNKFKIFASDVYNVVKPVIVSVVEGLTGLFEWLANLSPGVLKLVIAFAALGTAMALIVGPILILAGMFVTMSAAIAAGGGLVAVLGGLASIMAVVALAIVALAAVGYLVWQNWDAIKAAADRVWPAIKKTIADVVEFLRPLVIDTFNSIKENVTDVMEALSPLVSKVWSDIQGAIQRALDFIGPYVPSIMNGIKIAVEVAFKIVQKIFDGIAWYIVNILIPYWSKMYEIFKVVAMGIGLVLYGMWRVIEPIFKLLVWIISEVIIPVVKFLAEQVINHFQRIWEVIKVAWAIIEPILKFLWEMIKIIADAVIFFGGIAFTIFMAIATVIQKAIEIAMVPLQMIYNLISAVLGPVFEWLWGIVSKIFGWIADKVGWVWDRVKGPLGQIASTVKDDVGGAINQLSEWWSKFWDGASGFVSRAWGAVKGAVNSFTQGILGAIQDVVNSAIDGINKLIRAYNSLPKVDDVKELEHVYLTANPRPGTGTTKTAMHTGGLVEHMVGEFGRSNLRSDEVMRVLQTGEGVLRRSAMKQIGSEGFHALNNGEMPTAKGGTVLTIAPGAVQITVQGSIDENMIPVVQREIEASMRQLLAELRSN